MESTAVERLKDAIEGECEGLAITDEQAAAILAHIALSEATAKEAELALKEATALAVSLFNQHYRSDESYASGEVIWKPFDDIRGVVSQIDNMTAGLSRSAVPVAHCDAVDDTRSWSSLDRIEERERDAARSTPRRGGE